ncbi:MAG: toll/interleukin-1 receptor domain-containing protein, partial [Verrucomicrobiaceae bacterium]
MRHKVFLSHHSADKPAVEELALRMRRELDIEPWLDKWHLTPGQPWQEEIEDAMRECDCCAVFIGKGDPEHGVLGPWQNAEMRALISRQVTERGARFAVIPVLLPGAERGQRSTLPAFLVANTWVEFRHTLDDFETFKRLLAGIRQERPGAPEDGLPALGECPYRGLEFFDVEHASSFFGREAVTQ